MLKVRNGVFETNSSSVHTIVVSNEPIEDVRCIGEPYFGLGEYGWEMSELNNSFERAAYFYTAACELYKRDVAPEIRELLAHYGYEPVFCAPEFDEGYLMNGHIDHVDDCEGFVKAMMNDGDLLLRFIFSHGSFVVTGNDNCDEIDAQWMDAKVARADRYEHRTFIKEN